MKTSLFIEVFGLACQADQKILVATLENQRTHWIRHGWLPPTSKNEQAATLVHLPYTVVPAATREPQDFIQALQTKLSLKLKAAGEPYVTRMLSAEEAIWSQAVIMPFQIVSGSLPPGYYWVNLATLGPSSEKFRFPARSYDDRMIEAITTLVNNLLKQERLPV